MPTASHPADEFRARLDSHPAAHVVAGEESDATDAEPIPTVDPATGDVLARPPLAGPETVAAAVASARLALDDPRHADQARRAAGLLQLADAVVAHRHTIAAALVLEGGKLRADAYDEVAGAVAILRHFAAVAETLADRAPARPGPRRLALDARRPLGVVAVVSPWNFPLELACWSLAPALAAGCAVVLKPDRRTPTPAALLALLAARQTDLTPGVVNAVLGGDHAGAMLLRSDIDGFTFTGNRDSAAAVARAASDRVRLRAAYELGGVNALIVRADADPEAAAAVAERAMCTHAGQCCVAPSLILAHRPILRPFADALVDRLARRRLGHPADPATTLGPLIDADAADRVRDYADDALALGCADAGPGSPVSSRRAPSFVTPRILLEASGRPYVGSPLDAVEPFGPVARVAPFDDDEDAVAAANRAQGGLAAGILTADLAAALRLAPRIRAGTVWINTYLEPGPGLPFGGMDGAGVGRLNAPDALSLFSERQAVVAAL